MSNNKIPDSTGLTFEKVWLVIQKNARQMYKEHKRFVEKQKCFAEEQKRSAEELKELSKQTDERFKETNEQIKRTDEQIKRTDEQIKRTDEQVKRTEKQVKRTSALLGELGNQSGAMEEYLVAPGLVEHFNAFNYHFSEASRNFEIFGENRQKLAEIDIMLENDDFILCVEVKMTPREKDIQKHIERLKIVQRYFKGRQPKEKKVIGAIAGTIFNDKLKNSVIENGMYAITPSGNTFKIDVPEGFQPKYFSEE